jgi:acetyltransferase-like isoleucine patch superfamily enzyme
VITGNLKLFKIDRTSALKSGTFIECSGGVSIGKYFHSGRGLTIFSTNHNWRSKEFIPYDSKVIFKPVKIGDAVWAGANVSIMPGAEIGDGAILGMGCVVTGKIPRCAIVIGNPGKVVGYRDEFLFDMLKNKGNFA